MLNDERRTVEESYTSATNSSNLRCEADRRTDVDVLIAASRKEKVQDRQGLAEAAGLKPIVIDIEHFLRFNQVFFNLAARIPRHLQHPVDVAVDRVGEPAHDLQTAPVW